jgi:MscS family membrane protein
VAIPGATDHAGSRPFAVFYIVKNIEPDPQAADQLQTISCFSRKEPGPKMARLVSLLILLRFFRIMLPPLQLPIESSQFAIIVIKLLTILFVVMLIMNLLAVFITYGERYTQRTESKLDEQLVPIIKRTLQAVIIGVGIIQGLRVMQIDVTALIAGISIGGLALALAAQDMLKNLFGSLTIFLDRPFQIGDWINFSGVDGTVEEVGFRSTRVRTFANSMVYVPNGKLADMIINNYGLRNYRRFKTTIALTYDTPPLLIENLWKDYAN